MVCYLIPGVLLSNARPGAHVPLKVSESAARDGQRCRIVDVRILGKDVYIREGGAPPPEREKIHQNLRVVRAELGIKGTEG